MLSLKIDTRTHTHTRIYIYIYAYLCIYECICRYRYRFLYCVYTSGSWGYGHGMIWGTDAECRTSLRSIKAILVHFPPQLEGNDCRSDIDSGQEKQGKSPWSPLDLGRYEDILSSKWFPVFHAVSGSSGSFNYTCLFNMGLEFSTWGPVIRLLEGYCMCVQNKSKLVSTCSTLKNA